ncbi:MAG TPA: VWA domain-containing protein [Methylomirabilota bacterium]|nr:VWA domain-containing protein [Methylomirabilota bacterium]
MRQAAFGVDMLHYIQTLSQRWIDYTPIVNSQKVVQASRGLAQGLVILLAVTATSVRAQEQSHRPEGWQGPWPSPQRFPPTPAPQPAYPAGKQVLDIPPQTQQPDSSPATQRTAPPPHPQPATPHPTQLLTVTVTDPQGHYVPGLQADDFLVYEEELPQKITYFSTGQDEPVSLGFLVDVSSSMENKIGRARHALRRFFQTIRPRDEVFLEAFNQRPVMVQAFTDSRALLDEGVNLLEPQGETALYDALLDGLRRIKQGRHQKRALVLLTDGLDTASTASLNEATNSVRREGVTVYTIGIGNPIGGFHRAGTRPPLPWPPLGGGLRFPGRGAPGIGFPGGRMPGMGMPPALGGYGGRGGGANDAVDVHVLQTFSNETGGRHFLLNTADVVNNEAVLDQAVQTISEELRQQYTVGYVSPLKGDVYRSIRVEVRRPGLSVRAQKGLG